MTKYTSYTEAFVSGLLWMYRHEHYSANKLIEVISDIEEAQTIAREEDVKPQTTAIIRTPQGYPSTNPSHDLYLAAERRIFDLEEELRNEREQCARRDVSLAATAAEKFLCEHGWSWNGEKWSISVYNN